MLYNRKLRSICTVVYVVRVRVPYRTEYSKYHQLSTCRFFGEGLKCASFTNSKNPIT